MNDIKTYPEGTPFTGTIGRTAAASEAAWPVPRRARPGAPNVLIFLLDDVGFAQLGCFGADIRTPAFDRFLVREREQWSQAVKVSGAKLD